MCVRNILLLLWVFGCSIEAFLPTASTKNRPLFDSSLSARSFDEGRRAALSSVLIGGSLLVDPLTSVAADGESFESIAARAKDISKSIDKDATQVAATQRKPDKTAYDFSLPFEGKDKSFSELIRQTATDSGGDKVRAVLVVNIKQDDPVARKAIPELISLASKYGREDASLAIVACPSDQGYYEPDTSALIRLKLASEYGYGINPSTVTTDKLTFLGSGAHPFWRWLQSSCRTPTGLGRIEGNFEKFLIDGRTGLPLRRYPRKYKPLNIADDIEALIAGNPLPPPRANWQEEWRVAAADAERDTYRFQKGLNYFDAPP